MEVILDSSFVLSAVRKNIDFLSQLQEQGFIVRIPVEVLQELKDLRATSRSKDKQIIDVALAVANHEGVRKIKLGHKKVDEALIEKGRQGYYIATLDREIKRKSPKTVVIYDAQKKVGIEKGSEI